LYYCQYIQDHHDDDGTDGFQSPNRASVRRHRAGHLLPQFKLRSLRFNNGSKARIHCEFA
jgi:hypothetical protein